MSLATSLEDVLERLTLLVLLLPSNDTVLVSPLEEATLAVSSVVGMERVPESEEVDFEILRKREEVVGEPFVLFEDCFSALER